MKIFTVEQMRAFDKEAIETYHIPSMVLMENAALRVVEFIESKFAPLREKRIVILCGKGNNGGDGFAIARHLLNAGYYNVSVFCTDDEEAYRGDALANFRILKRLNRGADFSPCRVHSLDVEPVVESDGSVEDLLPKALARSLALSQAQSAVEDLRVADIIVDALLGTGFSGVLREPLDEFLRHVIRWGATRVAVDLPSGLNADTGEAAPETLPARYTVTFAAPKRGLFLRDGVDRCGEVWVGSIGTSPAQMDQALTGCHVFTHQETQFYKPQRPRDAHKGDAGRVMVIGGSRGMSGAVAMASHAALQIGAGLCLAAVPDAILDTVAASVLEATTHPLPCDERGILTEAALEDLRSRWAEMQAVAIGPGTGRAASTWDLVRQIVRECPAPLVIDADALHALPEISDEVKARQAATILTPHPGEMSVLLGKKTGEIQEDRFGAVEECARKYGAVTVLKGAYSLVCKPPGANDWDASPSTWVNPTGNPGMATGGSGDVLTGTIAGLLAQTKDALNATLLGVYLHGLSGDLAFEKSGNGLTARDIAAHLGAALLELDKPRGEEINGRLRKLA